MMRKKLGMDGLVGSREAYRILGPLKDYLYDSMLQMNRFPSEGCLKWTSHAFSSSLVCKCVSATPHARLVTNYF